jgi:hypothetical protein
VVECLLCKCEVLSSNPSTTKKQNKKETQNKRKLTWKSMINYLCILPLHCHSLQRKYIEVFAVLILNQTISWFISHPQRFFVIKIKKWSEKYLNILYFPDFPQFSYFLFWNNYTFTGSCKKFMKTIELFTQFPQW